MTPEEYRKLIKDQIKTASNETQKITGMKAPEAWCILIDGERVQLHSGKSVWTKKRFAKSALRIHFEYLMDYHYIREIPYRDREGIQEEEYQRFLNEHVEFVPLKPACTLD